MEQVKELEALLQTFPQWEDRQMQIDNTDPVPENCGLFPLGLQELSRREDVTGKIKLQLRQSYLLRLVAPRGAAAAGWILSLQNWLVGKVLPGFGPDSVLGVRGGRLAGVRSAGGDIYEVTITVDYSKEKEYDEN